MSLIRWAFTVVGIIFGLAVLLFVSDPKVWRLLMDTPPRPVIVNPIDPDSELSHFMYDAGKASRAGDHNKAVELLTRALAIEPGPNIISQDLHARRGSEYNYLNMAKEAFADYDAAIRVYYYKPLSNDAIRSYMGRGYAALNLRQYARAKDDFDVVLKILPNDVPRSSATLAWRGGAWQGLRDREHAVADYKASLALDPKNEYARKGLNDLGGP